MVVRTSIAARRRPRSSARSRLAFLVSVWTLVSMFNEHKLDTISNIHLSVATPILLVEAVWYSEICYAGPRYKVRIDPVSGKVVPVYPEGYVPITAGSAFGSNTNVNTNTIATDDENTNGGDDPVEDMPIGASEFQNTNITNTDIAIDENAAASNPESYLIDNKNNITIGGDDRLLRSNRLWRDFDEDSETDAIVVSVNENTARDISNANEQGFRSLFEDDLEPGEFYVKPCICQDSRWTFARDAGLEQITLPPTTLNGTIDGDWSPNDRYTIFPPTPENSPNNFGLQPNDQLTYVQDGNPDGDLYLCRAQAMYCGVLVDMESETAPIVKCYDQNMRHIIARNAWPLILLWYFGLAVICCCTVHGRTAGDYLQDRLSYFFQKFVCCFFELQYDFNDRMLNRMIQDEERERRRRQGYRADDNDDDESDLRPWYFSNQRVQFERSLMAQVQWIWRHQEYMREINLREQGLPPPQLKLKVKRFRMETSTSNSKEGGFSNTPPPTSITTSSSKDDVNLKQHKGSVFGSIGRKLSSDNGNGDSLDHGASTTTSNESTCSSSSAENILINKDSACCRPCPDGNNDDCQEQSPSQGETEGESEFVTLDLEENEDETQQIVDESPMEHSCEDLDSLDAPTCAICFCAFEEGERIGDLACKHEFHIDCLKDWAQRKNACPLCNVRLGIPERPLPPPQDEHNNESSMDGSRHSLSNMMQWLRTGSSNNGNAGAGEIQVGSRMGMIGAVSAAADINAARERVARRSGGGR